MHRWKHSTCTCTCTHVLCSNHYLVESDVTELLAVEGNELVLLQDGEVGGGRPA